MAPRRSGDFTIQLATRRNAVLFLASLYLVIGLTTGNRAIAIAGEFLVILMMTQWFAGSRVLGHIAVKRTHHPRTFEDQEVTVKLEVFNRGESMATLIEVIDSFPPSGAYMVRQVASLLRRSSSQQFRYRQTCSRRRGIYILGPVNLRTMDPLGLFHFTETCDELTTLIVYPQAIPLNCFDSLGTGTQFGIGEEIVPSLGNSPQFAKLRPYRHGDPHRLIHWPSTARIGAPFIKEFDQEVVTEVSIFCDLFLLSLSGIGDLTSVEFRIKAAAALTAEIISRQHLVKVVAVKNPRQETRMGGGKQHLITILDWMALLKAEGNGCFEEIIASEAPLLKPGGTIILIMSSVHVNLPQLRDSVRLLRLRRVRVIAVIVDDRGFIKLRNEQNSLFQAAPPLMDLVAILKDELCSVYTIRNQQDVAERLAIPA